MSHSLPLLTEEELIAYFYRIHYSESPAANISTLKTLQLLHPQYLPFENLNSWAGQQVSLQADAVFEKLVHKGRGGYCFEQNQLFMRVLQTLGFEVTGLSARVCWMVPENTILPRSHMVLLVKIENISYLVDVGFGGMSPTAPINIDKPEEQHTPHEPVLVTRGNGLYQLNTKLAEKWQPVYRFTLEPSFPVDYEIANWYVSTHPHSRFINELICTRSDNEGRHALLNQRYARHYTNAESKFIEMKSPEQLSILLQDVFLIDLKGMPNIEEKFISIFKFKEK